MDPELFATADELPADLPADPLPTLKAWLDHATAEKVTPNPNAFTLATIDPDGRPSARIVLCRGMDVSRGFIQFYTNRASRKGLALTANPVASAVFHWDTLGLQARVSGPITLAPDEESDAYFASRHPASRIGAWASDQSQPIASRDDLLEKVMDAMRRHGADLDDLTDGGDIHIPRPPHWGGYRIWADEVELWVNSPVRIHDRARWTRDLTKLGDGFEPEPWSATRLQP